MREKREYRQREVERVVFILVDRESESERTGTGTKWARGL